MNRNLVIYFRGKRAIYWNSNKKIILHLFHTTLTVYYIKKFFINLNIEKLVQNWDNRILGAISTGWVFEVLIHYINNIIIFWRFSSDTGSNAKKRKIRHFKLVFCIIFLLGGGRDVKSKWRLFKSNQSFHRKKEPNCV